MITQALLIFDNTSVGALLTRKRVAGLSLLDRQIRTLVRAGITHLRILVPANADLSLTTLTLNLDVQLEFITWNETAHTPHNPETGFLLLHAATIHHHTSLHNFIRTQRLDFDLITQHPSLSTGPIETGTLDLSPASTSSSGAFLCSPDLFTLASLSISQMNMWDFLAQITKDRHNGQLAAPCLWQNVNTYAGARAAKKMLFSQVTKTTSGPISRHLNARLSIPISKILIGTGLSPHIITVLFVMTTGLGAAYLLTMPENYNAMVAAGILWQMAAVLDRCDGEIARVKLCESKFGAWFDTITDNIAYITAYTCTLIGTYQIYPSALIVLFGISAILAMFITLAVMFRYAIKTGSGSLQHYLRDFVNDLPEAAKGWFFRFMDRYAFLAKRDSFSFILFLAALTGRIEIIYAIAVPGLHMIALGVLISHRQMLINHRNIQLQQQAAQINSRTSKP